MSEWGRWYLVGCNGCVGGEGGKKGGGEGLKFDVEDGERGEVYC